ncbi:MAG: preprotein translocase subunit SecD, partial [Trebonia sp.]
MAVLILVMLFSILGSQTFSPGNWHQQFKVGLGLDLSSGTQVVLKAATPNGKAPSAAAMQQAITVLEARVNGTGNSGAQVQQQGSNLINVSVPGKPAKDVIALVSKTAQLAFRPVYLQQSYTGSTATPKVTTSPSPSPSKSATPKSGTQDVSAKLASPTATAKASGTAKASATATATSTAKASATPTATTTTPTGTSGTAYGDASKVNAATMKLFDKLVCTPSKNPNIVNDNWKSTVGYTDAGDQWDKVKNQIVSCDPKGMKYVLGPAVFEGTQLTGVTSGLQANSTQWVVNLTLNGEATKAFGTLTVNQNTNYLPTASTNPNSAALDSTAIVLDGNVQSAPETQGALTSGQFQITGPQPNGFSQAEANQLVDVLKFGQLPLNFTQQDVSSISAQVGRSSLNAGLFAGALGLILVIIYLFYYYRGLGIVSVSSLLLAGLLAYLSVVLLSWYQNFTMSLSAIAGLV